MVRYVIQAAHLERGRDFPLMLISIGIAAEDGRTYYAVDASMYPVEVSKDAWLMEHVAPDLYPLGDTSVLKAPEKIRQDIINFVGIDSRPEFWANYAAYNWVLFCQLFGTVRTLPYTFPKLCLDIRQEMIRLGNPPVLPMTGIPFHALDEAIWGMDMVRYLETLDRKMPRVGTIKIGGSLIGSPITVGNRIDTINM